jgi:hypothetical protein
VSDLARRQAVVDGPRSMWAGGLSLFGGILMVVMGVCALFEGLSAVRRDDVFVTVPNYVFAFDLTTWGWIHIALAVAAIVVGAGVLTLRSWGLIAGIVVAGLSIVANFLFIPQSGERSLLMIAFGVALIWAFSQVIRENRELAAI